MTIEEIIAGLSDYGQLVQTVTKQAPESTYETDKKQYDVASHKIFQEADRPNKFSTETVKDSTGKETKQTNVVKVSRLGIPFQKQIVKIAATFLCGNPIGLAASPADDKQKFLLAAVQKIWDDNKLDYKSKQLAKKMMAEKESAELWYIEPLQEEDKEYWTGILGPGAKTRLRVLPIAKSLGDSLYPIYDVRGDMIAFGRGYTLKVGDTKIEHFDIYTAENYYLGKKADGSWIFKPEKNLFGKIPVIYYAQPFVEWADVQSLIDRYEENLSNLADTNDYFGSPMVAVTGGVKSFAKKGATGKMIEIENGGKVEYVTWQQAPASVKMEMDELIKQIYTNTDTPDISFSEMKGLGVFSGIALKMLFLAAHMKASDKEEIFGEGIQRRINFLKAAVRNTIDQSGFKAVQLTIKPKFEYFLPKNDLEKLDTLIKAKEADILSAESSIEQNPLVQDPKTEKDKIKTEANAKQAAEQNKLEDTFA